MSCIPEISVDTVMVYERLIAAKVDEVITYADLAKTIGRQVPYSMLSTARHKAMVEKRIVFATIHKVGIKRLADSDIVTLSTASFRSIQNTTRRERSRLSSVEFDTLPRELKVKHSATAAALAMIHEVASKKQLKVLEDKTDSADGLRRLSMMQALDAIRTAENPLSI
jgi:hypothetical protein